MERKVISGIVLTLLLIGTLTLASNTQPVKAEPTPYGPTAGFTASLYYPRVNWTVTFNASASLPGWNGTQETPIVSYGWSFGDGTPLVNETDPLTTHAYTAEGNYTVTLNVTDSQGLWDTVSDMITVYPVPPSDLTAIGLTGVLELQMSIPKTVITIGETVNITLTLRNAGGSNITVWFGSSQSFDVYLYYDDYPFPINAWSYDKGFLLYVWDLSLNPGETYTATLLWNFYRFTGYEYSPPSPGNYSLVGLCVGLPAVVTSELPIRLVRYWSDMNGDGVVNILDVIRWLLIQAGYITEPQWTELADINGDGQINVLDFIKLLLAISGY